MFQQLKAASDAKLKLSNLQTELTQEQGEVGNKEREMLESARKEMDEKSQEVESVLDGMATAVTDMEETAIASNAAEDAALAAAVHAAEGGDQTKEAEDPKSTRREANTLRLKLQQDVAALQSSSSDMLVTESEAAKFFAAKRVLLMDDMIVTQKAAIDADVAGKRTCAAMTWAQLVLSFGFICSELNAGLPSALWAPYLLLHGHERSLVRTSMGSLS